MKLSFLFLLLSFSMNSLAVEYKCFEAAEEIVGKFLKDQSEGPQINELEVIFECKSVKLPFKETYQWGDGSGLVGIQMLYTNDKCEVTEKPYTGQDDQDLDLDWARENCQDFQI